MLRRKKLGPQGFVGISMSRPEAEVIQLAAKRAKLPVSAWCRNILVPIALNALADLAEQSNKSETVKKIDRLTFQRFTADPD